MALGYFTLAFGGSPAKPYATIDGQRYEVVVDNFVDRPTSDPHEARYIVDHGKKLQIRGNEDGSISLLDNGTEARAPAEGLDASPAAERDPLTIAIMLVALSLISVGNGFFKPNISTIVGIALRPGRPAAGCRFHDLLHGHQPGLDLRAAAMPAARRLASAGGRASASPASAC